MPINNDLPDHPFLINFKTGEKPKTKFVNHLDAVNVELLHGPTVDQLKHYIPEFASGTWEDVPKKDFTNEEREQVLVDLFSGSILPTALESIKLTFRVDGLDLNDVPHLIRHRLMGFSAQGTGDRDIRHDDILIKPSIIGSKYEARYCDLMNDAKQLYADLMDDPEIPILDPRTVLPRSTSNYYYFTLDLKAVFAFVKQRKDVSIEPESMNIFAIKLWIEVVKLYPLLKGMISFTEPDHFAIKTSIENRSSNFYMPEEKNDIYDYKESWFCRGKRSSMRGGDQYIRMEAELLAHLEAL